MKQQLVLNDGDTLNSREVEHVELLNFHGKQEMCGLPAAKIFSLVCRASLAAVDSWRIPSPNLQYLLVN